MYLSLPPQCTTFGKIQINFGNTVGKCLGNWETQDIQNVPSIFPKFTRILPKVVHCGGNDGYILNVLLRFITSTPFWCILGFTGWEHHGHITGDTAKYFLNEPLGNIAVTFFSKLGVFPMYYLMGTSWSHDLEHCECTSCFLAGDIIGKPAGKILKIFVMYQVGTCMVHCPFPCNVLMMYQPSTLVLAPSVRWRFWIISQSPIKNQTAEATFSVVNPRTSRTKA